MRKIHLLCNAHLDPAWLWRWNEGVAAALSTFRVAADFCEEYDGFVFNHNESILYEWVEEYEPALFERIKKLVKEGKWKIVGGWYLQPDCNLPSGESFLSQIKIGNDYFMEKFGVKPTTAMNVDPFGHSRGLVSVLKLCGYDSYMFMRPQKFRDNFLWQGYDGSTVVAHGISRQGGYGNGSFGGAPIKIRGVIDRERDNLDTALILWGVGNHGGGPSRIDLEGINEIIRDSDFEIIHSNPEDYLREIDKAALPVVEESLVHCLVGCYTTMIRMKQANRRLENAVAVTEKAMCYAEMATGASFDNKALLDAKKAIAFCQFHDILPGSAIKRVEEDGLRTFAYAEEILDKLYTKAFYKLCDGQKRAEENTIPIMVFNPHPYEVEGEFECGYMLGGQNWNEDEETLGSVYDENGNAIPSQNELPDAIFEIDWIKKIVFRGRLKPSGITRFDCRLKLEKKRCEIAETNGEKAVVYGKNTRTVINKKNGLLEAFEVNGKNLIRSCGCIEVMKDDEDPWAKKVTSFKNKKGEFTLLSDARANEFNGHPENTSQNVKIIEDGDVRTKIQATFGHERSVAVVEYTIPKNDSYVDIRIKLLSNEPNVMLKYRIDTAFSGTPVGEEVFGREMLLSDESECVYHKWCGMESDSEALYVINSGIYAGSFTDSTMKLSLLRTPVYSANPLREYRIVPEERNHDHIDMGEREFFFRITTSKDIFKEAQCYGEAPRVLSFFPSGDGEKIGEAVKIDNRDIIMSSFSKDKDRYVLTLFNSSDKDADAEIMIPYIGKKYSLHFGKYEIKRQEILI